MSEEYSIMPKSLPPAKNSTHNSMLKRDTKLTKVSNGNKCLSYTSNRMKLCRLGISLVMKLLYDTHFPQCRWPPAVFMLR